MTVYVPGASGGSEHVASAFPQTARQAPPVGTHCSPNNPSEMLPFVICTLQPFTAVKQGKHALGSSTSIASATFAAAVVGTQARAAAIGTGVHVSPEDEPDDDDELDTEASIAGTLDEVGGSGAPASSVGQPMLDPVLPATLPRHPVATTTSEQRARARRILQG